MPRFLKKQTIQRIDAAKRMLRLAIIGLACPRHLPLNQPGENSAELGLIGSAAELALAAVIVEIESELELLKSNGTYYSAGEVLGAFREKLRSSTQLPACLGLTDPERRATAEHLLEASQRFGALFTARAGALHTGQGASRDVCYLLLSDVLEFLEALRSVRDWRSSLRDVPECPTLPKERTMLVSELLQLVKAGKGSSSINALSALFLVAPELPTDEPSWIQPLARVMARPRKGDVAILLKTLEQAKVGELYKVGNDAEALAVRITDDDEAPAISMQNTKTTLIRPEGLYRAQVGTANGNLENGILDLPNIRSIYDLFRYMIRNPELLKKGIATTKLGAHEVWPVIATSLRYQGTWGPIFFILRQLAGGETGQVSAILKRAANLDHKLSKTLEQYAAAIGQVGSGALLVGTELPKMEASLTIRETSRPEQLRQVRSMVPRNLMVQDLHDSLVTALDQNKVGDAIDVLLGDDEGRLSNRTPMLRRLLDVALHADEAEPVVKCLHDVSLVGVHTNARRALQVIDYSVFGRQLGS